MQPFVFLSTKELQIQKTLSQLDLYILKRVDTVHVQRGEMSALLADSAFSFFSFYAIGDTNHSHNTHREKKKKKKKKEVKHMRKMRCEEKKR